MPENDIKELVKYLHDSGCYSLHEVFELVEEGQITKEDFKDITRFNYDGVKESRGW